MRIDLRRPAKRRRVVHVAGGVDTLHLFTRAPISPAWRDSLEAAKQAAKADPRPQLLVVGPLELAVASYGTAAGAYLLQSDLFAVKVAPTPLGEASPTVSVEVRALALWSRGWRAAADLAEDVMRELCRGLEGPATAAALNTQVTRLDVCVDFQGWTPAPEDLDRFTCRARRAQRGRHYGTKWLEAADSIKAEKSRALALMKRLEAARSNAEAAEVLRELHREDTDSTASTWGDQRVFTGFSFGRGSIAARLYDKTRELSVSRKGWFREVWRRSGRFDEEAPVWRLEYQLRREALVDFHEATDDPEPGAWNLGEWATCRERLGMLWRHLSGRWLRRGHRTAVSRQVPSPPWRGLQRLVDRVEAMPELHRVNLRESTKTVLPQLAGYLATAAAQLVELNPAADRVTNAAQPFSSLVVQALAAAHAYSVAKERPMLERFKERRARNAARRRALTGPRRALAAHVAFRDMDCGRQAPLLVHELLRDFGMGLPVHPPTAAQRYAERLGVLVVHDEADDVAGEKRQRRAAELENELVQLHKALADATELDRHDTAEELRGIVWERSRLLEELRAA